MIRQLSRSTTSALAVATAIGLFNVQVAHAAVSVTEDAVVVDGAAAEGSAAPQDTASPETAADEQSNSGLTDIVVTATKRETNLQKTPISIAVLGEEDIKKRQVLSLGDLADGAIPSLRVATFESRQSALTVGIRGIVPGDANQPAREQGVGIYLDGVYLGRQHGLNASLFDIARIEVLKGPQGTLFGRNTEGGAVSIVAKAPTGEFGGRASFGFGNFGSYNGTLHLDLPEVANISIKLSGVVQHQGPTIKNPLGGQAGWNQYHRYGGRVVARWQPVDDLTLDLAFDKSRDENTPFYSQLVTITPTALANIPKDTSGRPLINYGYGRATVADIGVPQNPSIDITQGFSATGKYKLSSAIELRSITAWRTVSDEQWDNSGGAHRTPVWGPNVNFSRYSLSNLDQRQFSQELQAVGSVSNFDYVLGLYYFNERANDAARTPNTNRWNSTLTGYTINDPAAYPLVPLARASIAYAKSYAAYGNVTWTPIDPLHLTVGGRYTLDKKNGRLFVVNGTATNFTFNQRNERFDPLIVLAWEASSGINVYAKYATGYRAGGASSRSVIYRSFGPESVKSYELGLKTEFFDRKLRFNVAGYLMDRKDSQVDFNSFLVDPISGLVRNTLETVNATGITKIRGVEADLTLQPVDGLSMSLSYVYTSAKIPQARNTVQEAKNIADGNPGLNPVIQNVFIVYTPTNALSGSIDYEIPVGGSDAAVRFHLDGNYADPVYSFDNEPVRTDKSFIVNARVSLADIPMGEGGQKLTVSAWARNLLNEEHIYRRSAANTTLGDYANYNAPRTFGLDASLKF